MSGDRPTPPQGAEIEITPSMIDAAMARLWKYDDASEYIDRGMMQEILLAALSGIKRAAQPV